MNWRDFSLWDWLTGLGIVSYFFFHDPAALIMAGIFYIISLLKKQEASR